VSLPRPHDSATTVTDVAQAAATDVSAGGPRHLSRGDRTESTVGATLVSGFTALGTKQQPQHGHSRLRRPSLQASEFVRSACLDSIAHPSIGRVYSAYIPDHG
jgi:hypothetical protein